MDDRQLAQRIRHDLDTIDWEREVWKNRLIRYRHGCLPDYPNDPPPPDPHDTFARLFPDPATDVERARARDVAATAAKAMSAAVNPQQHHAA